MDVQAEPAETPVDDGGAVIAGVSPALNAEEAQNAEKAQGAETSGERPETKEAKAKLAELQANLQMLYKELQEASKQAGVDGMPMGGGPSVGGDAGIAAGGSPGSGGLGERISVTA